MRKFGKYFIFVKVEAQKKTYDKLSSQLFIKNVLFINDTLLSSFSCSQYDVIFKILFFQIDSCISITRTSYLHYKIGCYIPFYKQYL